VEVCCHSGHASGENLATLGREFLEEVRVLEVDRIRRDVETTVGHGAVGAAEVGLALWCLWRAH